MLLNLVDDGLVLEDAAVVREVYLLWLLGEDGDAAAGILIALLKGKEGGGGLASESKGGGDCGPVELECCASLKREC